MENIIFHPALLCTFFRFFHVYKKRFVQIDVNTLIFYGYSANSPTNETKNRNFSQRPLLQSNHNYSAAEPKNTIAQATEKE